MTARSGRLSAPVAVLLTAGLVLYGNALAWPALPEWVGFTANLLVGGLAVLGARRRGYSLEEIGLSKFAGRRG